MRLVHLSSSCVLNPVIGCVPSCMPTVRVTIYSCKLRSRLVLQNKRCQKSTRCYRRQSWLPVPMLLRKHFPFVTSKQPNLHDFEKGCMPEKKRTDDLAKVKHSGLKNNPGIFGLQNRKKIWPSTRLRVESNFVDSGEIQARKRKSPPARIRRREVTCLLVSMYFAGIA